MPPSDILDPDERALWRSFLSWSQSVIASVGRDLDERSGLSIPDVEVLGRLWDGGRSLDQQELGRSLRWSASRLSHHLARMVKRGLVRREQAGPGRRVVVHLTQAGEDQALAAFAKLAGSIREHFLDGLSAEERAMLRSVVERP